MIHQAVPRVTAEIPSNRPRSLPNLLIIKQFKSLSRWFPVALLTVSIGACSLLPRAPLEQADFIAQGKLSVRPLTPDSGRPLSATFRWRQLGEAYQVDLWGPLGQGHTRLEGTPQRLRFSDSRGRELSSTAPQALLRQEFGWSLPLALVPRWLQGQDPGGRAAGVRDDLGDLRELSQAGWRLELDRYQAQDDGQRRPGRVRGQNQAVRVTLLIRSWQTTSGAGPVQPLKLTP